MAQKTGALIFDEQTDRYDIRFDIADYYGGLHCGECFDVFTGGKWKPTRIEMSAAQEGENTEVGTRFLCLLRKFFLTPYYNEKPRFANFKQKKNAAISKRLQRFLKPIQFSFSTSAISFAVAVTIRMPLSLMLSSSVSSCRLCVDFSAVLSGKKNWSTDMS